MISRAKEDGLIIKHLCKTAKVSISGYYYWCNYKGNKYIRDKEILDVIIRIHEETKHKAGIRRTQMILENKHKIKVNLKKVQRIKRDYELETKIRRKNKWQFIAKKGLEHRTSENILNRDFNQTQPDKVYSTDISYLPYGKNKDRRAYLSATKDLATKEIVDFTVSTNIGTDITIKGLEKMFLRLSEEQRKKLIMHSDQGFHYTNLLYINKLKRYGVIQSMSRKGNCLDNAPIESFFGHMKDEIDLKSCNNFEEVKKMVEKYMNYYNNERYQWGLKKMTPVQYRCHLKAS